MEQTPSPPEHLILQGSAVGKFILVGEHSIVSRGRAIAFPLKEATLKLTFCLSDGALPEDLSLKPLSSFDNKVFKMIELLCQKKGIPFDSQKIHLSIQSAIPEASGLGSSASLAVAASRAFKNHTNDERQIAVECENFFHLKTSGLDPTVVHFEKPLIYRSVPENKFQELEVKDFQDEGYFFALIPTGIPHDTFQVQQRVLNVRDRTPLLFEDLMNSLSSNVEETIKIFHNATFDLLPRIIKDSHFRLLSLGLSTDRTEAIVSALESFEGFKAAKITGAGLGGYVLALFRRIDRTERSQIQHNLRAQFQNQGPVFIA
jgi:mevalonate kinase